MLGQRSVFASIMFGTCGKMSYFQGDWGQPWGKKHPVLSQNEKGQDLDNSLIE